MARDKVNNGTTGRFNITTPYNLTKSKLARKRCKLEGLSFCEV